MRILFYPLWEPGHLFPMLPLARALAARGHDVVFMAVHDLRATIERRGFRCVPVHEASIYAGALHDLDALDARTREMAVRALSARVDDELTRGRLEAQLSAIAPDLVLADVVQLAITFAAHRIGLPCRRLSTSFSLRHDELPPVTSALGLDSPPFIRDAQRSTSSCEAGGWWVEPLAMQFGYPLADVCLRSDLVPALTLHPELLLAPAALDFPRSRPGPEYLTMGVETDREESVPPELAAFVDGARPLVYASLGTQANRYGHAPRMVRAMREAMAARPDLQGALVVGEALARASASEDGPSNLLVLARAPQLWALRRSAVFVTHAGLGSVREAIALRVPMIAVPQGYDQPGNAARVVHHRLGVHVPAHLVDGAALLARLDAIMADREAYSARLDAMARACESAELERRAVELVESCGSRSGARTPSTPSTREHAPAVSGEPSEAFGWVFLDEHGACAGGREQPRIRAGAVVETNGPPALGVRGVTVCPNLGDALHLAVGSRVARVRLSGTLVVDGDYVVGQRLECLWTLEAGVLLEDLARRWTERSLHRVFRDAPETIAACLSELERHRALAAKGAPLRERMAELQGTRERLGVWERELVVAALIPLPVAAAFAVSRLTAHLAARAESQGENAGAYAAARAAEASRLRDELLRRVVDDARAHVLAAARVDGELVRLLSSTS